MSLGIGVVAEYSERHDSNLTPSLFNASAALSISFRLLRYAKSNSRAKPRSRKLTKALAAAGIRVIMLTGDNPASARAVADQLGLKDVQASATPESKKAYIQELQSQGHRVAMAGDGVNDGPALAQADIGIAMESGTDVALASADLTLLKGDLRGLARARELSRAVMKNIRQNLFLAFIYNLVGVPIAAGVLYPSLGILLNPMFASVAMTLSSLSVVLNALRLRGFHSDREI